MRLGNGLVEAGALVARPQPRRAGPAHRAQPTQRDQGGVLNNQILGYQKHAETTLFGAYTDACDCASVDHAAIARACGVRGIRIEAAADLAPALRDAFARSERVVLDVITDPDAYPPITSFTGKLPPSF